MKRVSLRLYKPAFIIALSLILVFISGFFGVKTTALSTPVNLIVDGGFEEENNGEFWSLDSKCRFSTSSGEKCLKVSRTSGVILSYFNVTLEEGVYTFSINVLQNKNGFNAELRFNDREIVIGSKTVDPDQTGTVSWENFEIDGETAGEYNVEIYFSGLSASIYVDDFELYKNEEQAEEPSENGNGNIITLSGACLKMTADCNGIRFCGRVKKDYYDGLSGKSGLETGMLIAPTDYIGEFDFTANSLTAAGKSYKEIAAVNKTTVTDGGTEYYEFYCALVDIIPYNTDRNFSARTYIKYRENETDVYEYSEYNAEDQSRSAFGMAVDMWNEAEDKTSDTAVVAKRYIDVIEIMETEGEMDGGVYTITYESVSAGYFTVKSKGNTFTVLTVNGEPFSGLFRVEEETDVTVVASINGEFGEFPIYGKLYKE